MGRTQKLMKSSATIALPTTYPFRDFDNWQYMPNNTASIGFEQQIWAAADILCGNMDAAEYKHVVLGLIFLKYISDKFDEQYNELEADDDDVEDKDAYTEVNVFFVPPTARWNVCAINRFCKKSFR